MICLSDVWRFLIGGKIAIGGFLIGWAQSKSGMGGQNSEGLLDFSRSNVHVLVLLCSQSENVQQWLMGINTDNS